MAALALKRPRPLRLPERLRQMNGALARNEPPLSQRLADFLLQAGELFAQLNLPGLLTGLLGQDAAVRILSRATGFAHLGFMAPAECEPHLLADLATRNGFCHRHALFSSEIMARELAWRLGEPVPTTIFRADAARRAGLVPGIEAFLPTVDAATARGWIADGTGCHFALGLGSPGDVEEALGLCQARGYHPPALFEGHPLLNVANAITVVYVDAPMQGEALRWEFYHTAAESATQ